ncbi:hypothetical protein E2C01_011829 [Portunus trituberculatus]|uniref:Reverse transcriptase domain-containing protein n=1 Tax=Portunus trituberculatus TaxID=210409 RepID=A0A5B7DC98_PORTR|nr:hypothetical protein [Portunus trituberculatus]
MAEAIASPPPFLDAKLGVKAPQILSTLIPSGNVTFGLWLLLTEFPERQDILDLEVSVLDKGTMERIPATEGFYSHLFLVPNVSGGFQSVLDLSAFNTYVDRPSSRWRQLQMCYWPLIRIIQWCPLTSRTNISRSWCIQSCKYLWFNWKTQPLKFRVLCFGLSTAPYGFTGMMALISAASHQKGICLLHYLNDWLLLTVRTGVICFDSDFPGSYVPGLGVTVSWDKSNLYLSQKNAFLEMEIHSTALKAFPTWTAFSPFWSCSWMTVDP